MTVQTSRVPGALRRVRPQLESPARTRADGSTAGLRGGGKPGHAHRPAGAGGAHPSRAPAPAARQGPQVARPGCERVARGPCEAARSARRTAVPPSALSAPLHGKLGARCVLGAAPARVAACRAQAEPGREDGAGYAPPGEGSLPPAPVLGRFLRPRFQEWGCPRGAHGAVNLGSAGVSVAPRRATPNLEAWPLPPVRRWFKRRVCLRSILCRNFPSTLFIDTKNVLSDNVAAPLTIPKEVAAIFNAPSDDEEFVGFQDDVPMETLSGSFQSLDSLELEKQDVCFHSKYLTEELRRIFIEDTDSEAEDFEGFTESELNVSSDPELLESELSDSGKASVVSEEEQDEEEEAVPRRGRSTRSSFGLRVAFQFPTKKLAKTPGKNSSRLVDSKTDLGREKSCRQAKEGEDTASESEDDTKAEGQENSDALLKRARNIKENKAMKRRTSRRAFSEGQIIRRTNPTRSARPPEKFALENFAFSAAKLTEELYSFRRRKTISGGKCQKYRRRHRVSSYRSVKDITEEDLENIAITVRDKVYDKVLGNTCHQCRQKTIDTKTVCRNQGCGGVRGQFCGPCLRNRYGEDVRTALLDPLTKAAVEDDDQREEKECSDVPESY
ncbi:cell division cycle associated 7 like [Cricetulus griseus]